MTGHVTATRLPPHSPATLGRGHVPGHVPGIHAGSCDESCARLCVGTFDHGNLPRALGPRALSAALGPLATYGHVLPFGPWPLFPRGQHPLSTMADGGLRLSAALGPPPASNLRRPLAHKAPLATISYQGIDVIRNGRVIKPIVRGGGHGGRGGRNCLGGISWWCGGIS